MLERIALVLLLAAAARAQEPAPAVEDPNVLLTKALQRLKTADAVSASVNVEHAPPEADQKAPAPGGGGGFGVIVEASFMGELPPFEGRVEAFRAADGTAVVVSDAELPGFVLWVSEGRAIERTTFEEDRFSLAQLRGELLALLDPGAFVRRIVDAKLAATRDEATGKVTFRGKVDRDIVPPTEEMGQGRVLGAEATLVVRPDGTLESAAVKITRSDAAREMLRTAPMKRIVAMGGAPPLPEDDGKHDIVGGSTTYTISFKDGLMSERAKAFKAEAERLLNARGGHGDPLPPGDVERK